jgi:hypothetical protein
MYIATLVTGGLNQSYSTLTSSSSSIGFGRDVRGPKVPPRVGELSLPTC